MNELTKLSEFLNALPGKAIDFYPVSDSFTRPYLQNINKDELEIFGRTMSDCLVGFWKKSNVTDPEKELVVWIDSEGSLNSVIASGITEFISLLYFDTGFIYDTLSAIKRKGKPSLKSKEDLDELERTVQENYFYCKQLQEFIRDELKISKSEYPELLIYEAKIKNDNFAAWFEQSILKNIQQRK